LLQSLVQSHGSSTKPDEKASLSDGEKRKRGKRTLASASGVGVGVTSLSRLSIRSFVDNIQTVSFLAASFSDSVLNSHGSTKTQRTPLRASSLATAAQKGERDKQKSNHSDASSIDNVDDYENLDLLCFFFFLLSARPGGRTQARRCLGCPGRITGGGLVRCSLRETRR